MLPAIFGITNDGVNLVVNLIVLALVVVWLALIYWTYVDAKRRLEDPVLIGCSVAASLFPFIGTVIYSIVRPGEYLEDARERDLEVRSFELQMRQLEAQVCPSCSHPVQPSYLRCPGCGHRLKHACPTCARPVAPDWSFCPYCESSLRGEAPSGSGQRRTRRVQRSSKPPAEEARKAEPGPPRKEPAPAEDPRVAEQPTAEQRPPDASERQRRRAERQARRTQTGP